MIIEKSIVLAIIALFLTEMIASPVVGEHEVPQLKEWCSDYGGDWNDDDDKCEFNNEKDESDYEDYICNKDNSEVKYPTVCYSENTKDDKHDVDDNNNKDSDQLIERDIAVLCGASEDYEANKEQCDKLYDMLEEGIIEDDPDFEYD
jgi:hypothetical protein